MSPTTSSTAPINTITITQPDDWHLHLRDDAILASVLPHTARQFARAIVMPNLKPPVTTTAQALAYRDRIIAALPAGMQFEPLMTLYLTDKTTPDEIRRAKDSGLIHAVKLYPAGATTNSDAGVTDLRLCYPTLEVMQECGMPFLVHGEVTDPEIDLFDREAVFIERVLRPLRKDISPPNRPPTMSKPRQVPLQQPLQRIICCITETLFFRVGSDRITIAYRS